MTVKLKENIPYFFDTNAIYYFCGENVDKYDIEGFRKDFKTVNYKIMPSCVYQEVIVKYKENKEELGRILNILADNDFKISPSQYDFLDNNFNIKMLENTDKAIASQYNKKIDNESRLIYLIIYSVSMVVIRTIGLVESLSNVDVYMSSFVKNIINPKEDQYLSDIKNRLNKAYDEDNTEQKVKEIYLYYLFDFVNKAHSYAYILKQFNLNEGNYNKENVAQLKEEYLKTKNAITLKKYRNNFSEYIKKYTKDKQEVIKEALECIPLFFKKHKYTDEQCNYLKLILKKLLCDAAKLEKNDIYDIFYMFSFSDYCKDSFNTAFEMKIKKEDMILVSFDKKVKNYISTFSHASISVIDSYKK